MQRGEMGIVNGNPMGMGLNMVGEWECEWLYGNGREWESERHSRTPLLSTRSRGNTYRNVKVKCCRLPLGCTSRNKVSTLLGTL